LERNLDDLAGDVRERRYRPQPVLRIRPPFLAQPDRALVVPTVRDRVLQRAVADLLRPRIEPLLTPACAAFRKGGSATAAADRVGRWVEEGFAWALRADVAAFFDTIRPDLLLDKLRPFVDEPAALLLGRIVRARVFDHDVLIEPVAGIPQGSPLSPLLANLYLADMDRRVVERHPRYLRYCDDLIVLERGEAEVVAARSLAASELSAVGLELNERKTQVARVEDGFTFLGYRFGPSGKGPAVKSLEALRFRLDELARKETPPLDDLDALFRGWSAYYGLRPEAWTESAVGVLALVRQQWGESREHVLEKIARPRWRLGDGPPWLGPVLAAAWRAAGVEELAWVELARRCAKGRTLDGTVWAECLGLPAETVGDLVHRLGGSEAGERLALLAEAATDAGRYEAASRLGALGPEPLAGPAAGAKAAPADLSETADYELLARWFQGGDGAHAVEQVSRGHRRFVPDHRPIGRDDWRAHLCGERTMALPLLRADGTAFFGVFDVDVGRQEVDRRLGVVDALLGRALGAALRLRGALGERGIEPALEFSGHKGYHLWVRFEEPVRALLVRRLLHGVLAAAAPLPEGIRVEVYPNRDRPASGTIGPIMKLPLGVHGRTGKRCDIVDEHGTPVEDPFEALRVLPLAPAGLARDCPLPTATRPPASVPELGPRAAKVVEGCRVVAHLREKVEATSYLNHGERTLLLCTLGHLGPEGAAALHALIGRTHNYRREVTDRHIARLPPHPISCGRIRERFPDVTAAHPCTCPAAPRSGGYPTPLLFALRASQVPTFRARRARPGPAAASEGARPAAPGTGRVTGDDAGEARALLARIAELRRHQRGTEASLERARAELAAVFDRLGVDAMATPVGTLRRRRGAAGAWEFSIEV
jgi:retron-type reverse transcriptase